MKTFKHKIPMIFALVLAAGSFASCKSSKKHKNSSSSCDVECEAEKERQRLEDELKNNQLGVSISIDGQSAGGTISMSPTDLANVVIAGNFTAQSILGLIQGPTSGMSLTRSSLTTSNLPNGSYPITVLIRDVNKCTSAGGTNCSVQIDSQGKLLTSVTTSAAYDATFNFNIVVSGGIDPGNNGNDDDGQTPGTPGTWNPPGFKNNPNTSFFGKIGDNLYYGVNWIWQWLKNIGQNN